MADEKKVEEAKVFVSKKGPEYVKNYATSDEREHFEGTIYKKGIPDLVLISYFSTPLHLN